MYKVLFQEEIRQRIAGADRDAWLCIAYEGSRGLRTLMFSLETSVSKRHEHLEMFETAALMLNRPPSLSVQKWRLRSIAAFWRKSEAARREQKARGINVGRQAETFAADFGRMDIGLNPGWGRD